MAKRQPTTQRAAAQLTKDEALQLAKVIAGGMMDSSDKLARFALLLKWLSTHADQDGRDYVYIWTEAEAMPFIDGTEDAVEAAMSAQLDALRKGGAR
jgi:hypothetical protein